VFWLEYRGGHYVTLNISLDDDGGHHVLVAAVLLKEKSRDDGT
jgi:hypothetical protein